MDPGQASVCFQWVSVHDNSRERHNSVSNTVSRLEIRDRISRAINLPLVCFSYRRILTSGRTITGRMHLPYVVFQPCSCAEGGLVSKCYQMEQYDPSSALLNLRNTFSSSQ